MLMQFKHLTLVNILRRTEFYYWSSIIPHQVSVATSPRKSLEGHLLICKGTAYMLKLFIHLPYSK